MAVIFKLGFVIENYKVSLDNENIELIKVKVYPLSSKKGRLREVSIHISNFSEKMVYKVHFKSKNGDSYHEEMNAKSGRFNVYNITDRHTSSSEYEFIESQLNPDSIMSIEIKILDGRKNFDEVKSFNVNLTDGLYTKGD